ncbi:MAG: hypothetical protein ACPL3C_10275 [Pyrobaculum sp.]
MVKSLKAEVREVKPAVAEFTVQPFGRVTIKLHPIDFTIYQVGGGYLVNILAKQYIGVEVRYFGGVPCAPELPRIVVGLERSELGTARLEVGSDVIDVYMEIVKVMLAPNASDIEGLPCVNAQWVHGIRVQPRS